MDRNIKIKFSCSCQRFIWALMYRENDYFKRFSKVSFRVSRHVYIVSLMQTFISIITLHTGQTMTKHYNLSTILINHCWNERVIIPSKYGVSTKMKFSRVIIVMRRVHVRVRWSIHKRNLKKSLNFWIVFVLLLYPNSNVSKGRDTV